MTSVVERPARLLRSKLAISSLLTHPAVGGVLARILHDDIPCRGVRIRTDASAILPTTKAQLFWGLYERAEISFARTSLRTDLDVVELGASIGAMGSHVLRRLAPGLTYTAVEANPSLQELLARNLERASAGRHTIRVVEAAVDASPGAGPQVSLHLSASSDASSLGSAGTGAAVLVRRLSLTDLVDQIPGGFVLVCDIEGAEVGLVRDDPAAWQACRQALIELHPTRYRGRDYSTADVLGLLLDLGFRLESSHGPVVLLTR